MAQSTPRCYKCRSIMAAHLVAEEWRCPECEWSAPLGGLCPTCLSTDLTEPDEDGCRICRGCACEVWPPRAEYLAPSMDRQAREAWVDELRYKKALSKPGGGSKSGRKRKKPAHRRLPWNEEGA